GRGGNATTAASASSAAGTSTPLCWGGSWETGAWPRRGQAPVLELRQLRAEAVDLVRGVVVDETDANGVLRVRELLPQPERVPVVVRPHAEAALRHPRRDVGRRDAVDVQEERPDPALHRLQSVHGHPLGEPVEGALAELARVGGDRRHAAERLEVRDRRGEAGEQLV